MAQHRLCYVSDLLYTLLRLLLFTSSVSAAVVLLLLLHLLAVACVACW